MGNTYMCMVKNCKNISNTGIGIKEVFNFSFCKDHYEDAVNLIEKFEDVITMRSRELKKALFNIGN